MRSVERVLEKLEVAAGPDGKGEYLTFCPAHDDRNTPNLRVRETEDGRVLLRCFAGCDQDEVLDALTEKGIGKTDLFANGGAGRKRGGGGYYPPRPRARLHARNLRRDEVPARRVSPEPRALRHALYGQTRREDPVPR